MTRTKKNPPCKHCGAPGEVKIGHWVPDGGGFMVFEVKYWECAECAKKTARFQVT